MINLNDIVQSESTNKELLIFVLYVDISNKSASYSRQIIMEAHENINKVFKKIERNTNYIIESFVFSGKETKLECIFPVSTENKNKIDNLLDSIRSSVIKKPEKNSQTEKMKYDNKNEFFNPYYLLNE